MYKGNSWGEGTGHSWTWSLPLLLGSLSVCLFDSPDITRQLPSFLWSHSGAPSAFRLVHPRPHFPEGTSRQQDTKIQLPYGPWGVSCAQEMDCPQSPGLE